MHTCACLCAIRFQSTREKGSKNKRSAVVVTGVQRIEQVATLAQASQHGGQQAGQPAAQQRRARCSRAHLTPRARRELRLAHSPLLRHPRTYDFATLRPSHYRDLTLSAHTMPQNK
ncbi:unnamed protein product [Parnassius apollo]|uniref:(apollo) hypothetical protein n=1 Tax=Parnassius apollo TaxID=110799 RepID=A0A8S3XV20_PARAO|nr:unnamed protein product [Parnassius apollo]